ncbi:DUF169 domain-containing protein [Methanosphaerula palustris]|uniref:DUF169 domain-containing protein n=1 Tax=Methanosphaerula palustris (strain ATCC BAA-1556 / DSM 19958 / E1-9c) TaxID=521011 RepID=B8GEQ5_METPE|nr:DUF169 domain-containing protein [Methanosphaerula palustris]ACL17756.1 conserved hypothetical protein [Methanosphaerula palustris E1-9c]
MKSITAERLRPDFEPVALLWSDTKPDGALQIKPHAQTCIMPFFAQVVTKGKTAVFDRDTCGCPGARAGLGFGNGYYDAFSGAGTAFMAAFFVKGAESSRDPDAYCAIVQHVPKKEQAKFIRGERLHSSTEKAERFMTRDLPITDIAERYVIVTPLSQVKPGERPVVVIFVANPLQIAGLVTLVGAIREGTDPVRVPPMAACQQIGAFVYDEAKMEHPRAVLGYTDLAARANVGAALPEHMFTFAVPFSLFMEMEEEAEDGVFDGPIWRGLVGEV